MLAQKSAGQGMILSFNDDAISNPLPELRLCGPELLPITANDQRRPLLLLLLFLFAQSGRSFKTIARKLRAPARYFRHNLTNAKTRSTTMGSL